ncbi:hypothetical protein BJV82DRAFT_309406 [Fennellomyces sp. T-0311]|nr:hypothetical protein BJV82DRAFT_309406 [Fennellomyces sp. T-0311]
MEYIDYGWLAVLLVDYIQTRCAMVTRESNNKRASLKQYTFLWSLTGVIQKIFMTPSTVFRASLGSAATRLRFDATNAAFEEGKRAYAEQNFDEAVKHYACALEALETEILSVIHLHMAAVYEKQNNLAPINRPVVTATCRPETLAPAENHQLVQLLPYEVLNCILSELSAKDCAQLGMTCRFWHDYIARKWPLMWSTVDPARHIAHSNVHNSLPLYFKAIHGKRVRKVHMVFPDLQYPEENPRQINIGNALVGVMDHRWEGVEFLSLKNCPDDTFDDILCIVKDSLKTLTLVDSNQYSNYAIEILDNAARNLPNLQSMTNYIDNQDVRLPLLEYLKETSELPNFHLTSLSLPRRLGLLESICKHTPALTSLIINSDQVKGYANLLNSVHEYCTALQLLNYSPNATQTVCMTHTQTTTACTLPSSGLRTLIFRPSNIQSTANINASLALVLQAAYKTLRTLELRLDALHCGQYTGLEPLIRSGAPGLQALAIDAQSDTISSQKLLDLISMLPSLVSVSLSGTSFWHNRLFDGLAKLSQIQKLSIGFRLKNYPTPRQEKGDDAVISTQDLRTLFEHAQNIHEFTYSYPGRIVTPRNSSFISGLARIIGLSTVRTLNLSSIKLTSDILPRVLKHLKKSKVNTLKIRMGCPASDGELTAFARIKCLSHLIIYDDDYHIKEDEVHRLLDLWQHPQMLFVDIRREELDYFIKGCKTGPTLQYSVKSCNPPPLCLWEPCPPRQRN